MSERFAHARAAIRHRLAWAALAALAGLGIGWLLGVQAEDRAASRRYASVARHESNGLDTCYFCFRPIHLGRGESSVTVEARYVSEWGNPVPVSIPVCGACSGDWDLAARTTVLESWKAVMTQRMGEAERRGWVSADLAHRRSAVYRNAFVTDLEGTDPTPQP